ncbi:hypothetical protein PV11_05696 [Exophiala sideris]|uniref:Uncharacterized protein n=1 Tax=Exophiala sideris TaxID=1016849 RepID=A0A0D1YQP9_9EURO|nr:hypothetical protein PV11_05696 [Exophiala sideris]
MFVILVALVLACSAIVLLIHHFNQTPLDFVYHHTTYLLWLLDDQQSYTEAGGKRMLRERCPQFAALNARHASNTARYLMDKLQYQGKEIIKTKPTPPMQRPSMPRNFKVQEQ